MEKSKAKLRGRFWSLVDFGMEWLFLLPVIIC